MKLAVRPLYRVKQFWQHVTARFTAEDDRFARVLLTPAEQELFAQLPIFEKRHAVDVARYLERYQSTLTSDQFRLIQKTALLHDIGKVRSGLSPIEKGFFVMLRLLAPRLVEAMARTGRNSKSYVFLHHETIGGELLRQINSEPKVIQLVSKNGVAPNQKKLLELLEEADEAIL